MQGGTLDRWKKLFQGAGNTSSELSEEFLPAEELDGWISGNDVTHHTAESYSMSGEASGLGQSKKVLPETRRVLSEEAPIKLTQTTPRQISEVRSALGPGTLIEGKFTFDSPVKIDGTIRGEVHSSSLLIIGEDGIVEGLMCVGSLVVLGRAKGSIVVEEKVQIGAHGEVQADIEGGLLAIELGGIFLGTKKGK